MALTKSPVLVLRDYISKRGTQALAVRVVVKSIPSYEDTGIRIRADQWDKEAQKVVNHKNASLLTGQAHRKLLEVQQLFEDAARRGDTLMRIPKQRPPKEFIEFMQRRLDEEKETLAKGTHRKYQGFIDGLKAWREELPYSQVDARLLRIYEAHSRKEGNTDNTLNKKMGYLLREARGAASAGLIDPEKLKGYKAPSETETTPTYLTKKEVDALEKFRTKTKNDTLRKITDWFLLACYSGLRYSDVQAFSPEMIQSDVVRLKMVKTGNWVDVPLHPRLEAVLRRMQPGVYSNQKFNDYLKVIADAAGIDKNLTTHVGRHTYAVTFLNADGTKIETLQELLGQKSMKSTKVYAKITGDRKAEEVKRVWGK